MNSIHDCYDDGVVGQGPMPADIMYVGISPGRDEWMSTKMPFTGPSGQLLNNLLKFINFKRDDVFVTNLICWWNDRPSTEEIAECYPRFFEEVRAVKPKLIVCLGKIVAETLMPEEAGVFSKSRAGVWWSQRFNCWMLATYHPAAYITHRGKSAPMDIADAARDFRKIPRILSWPGRDDPRSREWKQCGTSGAQGPGHPGYVEYEVSDSVFAVDCLLDHIASEDLGKVVAVDVETKYDPKHPNRGTTGLLSIAFTCEHGTTHVPEKFLIGPSWSRIDSIDIRWAYWNGQFDKAQTKKWLGINMPIREDGMLQDYSLDERSGSDKENDSTGNTRSVGIHGLKRNSREYYAAGHYDAAAKGRIQELTPDELAEYNAKDSAYAFRLVEYYEPLQIADDVRRPYLELMIPAANTLSEISERGCTIDTEALAALAREWLPEWLKLERQLQRKARKLGWDDKEEINLGSWQQLGRLIYDIIGHTTVEGEGRTTKMDVLKVFALEKSELAEFCSVLLEWRGLEHDITTWITGIEDDLVDGRIHPEALIHGTRVGRTSYHGPPIQTVPKPRTVGNERARIRRIFAILDESRVLMEADFSQSELWWAAIISNDANMLEDLYSGDFHARVAETAFHVTEVQLGDNHTEWERLRDSSKILTYGKLYGGGVNIITGENRVGRGSSGNYSFMEDKAEAVKLDRSWNERYSNYIGWRDEEKKYVMANGEQQSRTGRKRRYYQVNNFRQLNQAINMPVSSISHDNLFACLPELHTRLAALDTYIWFEVHDSIVFDVSREHFEEVCDVVLEVMQRPRFGSPIGIPVDIKVGQNWLDLKKVSTFKCDCGAGYPTEYSLELHKDMMHRKRVIFAA